MENDKSLLDGIISNYYNSVEDMFLYRLKNEWKFTLTLTIFASSTFFLFFNIIPILPLTDTNYLGSIFNLVMSYSKLPIIEYNFGIKWALGSLVSLIVWGVTYLPFKYWDIQDSKRALRPKYLSFCYIYTLRKDLKSYLINENEIHLSKSVSYLKKVINPITTIKVSDKSTLTIQELSNQIAKQFSWVDFTAETKKIIDSISTINDKIIQRIDQRKEIEKIVPLIDLLTLYEFSKIKPDEFNSIGITLKEKRFEYLKEFTNELDKIGFIENSIIIDERKSTRIKSIFKFLISSFSDSNILILFISWLILLSILFIVTSILVINFLGVKMDSTILIGLLTAPFIGAITLSATIYTKMKK